MTAPCNAQLLRQLLQAILPPLASFNHTYTLTPVPGANIELIETGKYACTHTS